MLIVALAAVLFFPMSQFFSYEVLIASGFNTILLYVLTLASYIMVGFATQKKNGSIVGAVMGSMVMKMIISLFYLLTFFRMYKGHEMDFAISFMVIYFLFTGYEVYYLLRGVAKNV